MKRPWSKFYWADWRSDPRLRMCSLAARGLWMEMLALMHEAEPYGYLLVSGQAPTDAQLSVLVGAPPSQIPELIGELELVGVFSRTRKNVIYSRRMLRDLKKASTAEENGKLGGNPTLGRQTAILPSDNPPDKPPDKAQKLEARDQKILSNDKISLREVMEKFEEWYRAYPLHKARGAAEKAWPRALKFADADTLIAGALRYAHECRVKGTEPKFQAYPATWLNEKRWLDEPEKPPAAVEVIDGERERWARRIQRWRETGFWLDNWGFPPSDPGCMAPVDLLGEQAAAEMAGKAA